MDEDKSGQSGYYREIARAFLERRGGAFFLSPKDQAMIAAWEGKRIPLNVVLEGIVRTFEGLRARKRGTRSVPLAFCERQVEAAFAQHRDRAAGRRKAAGAGPRTDKSEKARREIEKAVPALPAGDAALKRLLEKALAVLSGPGPDPAALERIDEEIEETLWAEATAAEKAAAEAEARKGLKGGKTAGFEDQVRRRAVMTARSGRRVPHVSLFYY
ncbi:MAG: hypothetical protein EHM31_11635 [Candidatus Aminicenantes bacterium]|nr:MAG: hypothetical protein EHM31_11635 [Candidatus Aminicenantes bacterium]